MSDDTLHAERDDRPEGSRRVRLSRTFDEDAELYDRARPGYPPELYDDPAELAGARPGSRVLNSSPEGRPARKTRCRGRRPTAMIVR